MNTLHLTFIFIILVVILITKLYLENSRTNWLISNKQIYDTQIYDSNYKKLMQDMYLDTSMKINSAVEKGYAEGFEAMNSNTNSVSYLDNSNVYKLKLFYKTKCSYCNEFLPTWYKIINNLPNNIKYEEIECESNHKEATANNIVSVPTIILFINNDKNIYMGDRSYTDIERFLKHKGVNLVKRTFEEFNSIDSSDSSDSSANNIIKNININNDGVDGSIDGGSSSNSNSDSNNIDYNSINSQNTKNKNCPSVTFDKEFDVSDDKYMFQIFNRNGQYGYSIGSNKDSKLPTPFEAAYAAVDSYLTSLPNSNTENECAQEYAKEIGSFGLCDTENLNKILDYKSNIQNGSSYTKFNGSAKDYSSNDIVVKAIKKVCRI